MELSVFFPFRISMLTVWTIHSSPENSKHMSGGVPGLVTTENNQTNQESRSLKTAQTYLCTHRSAPTASVRLCYWLQNIQNHQLFSKNRTDPKSLCSHRSNSYSFHPYLQSMTSFWKRRSHEVAADSAHSLVEIKQLSHPTPRSWGILASSVVIQLSKSLLCSLLHYFCPFPFLLFSWKPITGQVVCIPPSPWSPFGPQSYIYS